MGVDYVVQRHCVPKDALGIEAILAHLKNRERAQHVLQVYRDAGDERPETQIGFEMTRRNAAGEEDTELMIVADLLDEAAVLDEFAPHCVGCPANLAGKAYGCVGYINYPISNEAEIWLLEQLPDVRDPMLFIMLIRGIQEIGYSGQEARRLRNEVGMFFQNPDTLARRYTEMNVTTDILFEMTFQLGPILPAHGAMLMLFYGAIPRGDLSPDEIMALTRQELSLENFVERYPFLHGDGAGDSSTQDLKRFLGALYVAYGLDVAVLLDI